MSDARVFTHETIAELLPGVTRAQLRSAIAEQGLPGRKIGRTWYFEEAAVRDWLRHNDATKRHEANKRTIRAAKDDPKRYVDEIGE